MNGPVPNPDGGEQPIAVLHVVGPAAVGGLERVVQSLAIAQRKAGHRVAVAAILDQPAEDHPFIAPLARAGVEVRVIVASGRAYRQENRGVERLCTEFRPDVVHTHGRRVDVVGGAAAHRAGFPTVATVHGAIGGSLKNRLYMWVQHRALRRRDAAVAVSAVIAEKLMASGVPASQIHTVRNAWSPTSAPASRDEAHRELGLSTDGAVLGWVGRLSPEKAVDVFLNALASLSESAATAVVIGEGPELETARRQVERLGISDRVRFCGAVPDAARLFSALDCLVLSSHTEGTPIVLLEAMSAGVPIVTTRVGGVPDVVSEREARLVPAGDPAALAEAIRQVLDDPVSATRRADAAERRLHTEFGVEQWLREYDSIYRTVIGTR